MRPQVTTTMLTVRVVTAAQEAIDKAMRFGSHAFSSRRCALGSSMGRILALSGDQGNIDGQWHMHLLVLTSVMLMCAPLEAEAASREPAARRAAAWRCW